MDCEQTKTKQTPSVPLDLLINCPFCGKAPKEPYGTDKMLLTYCTNGLSGILTEGSCPISGIPMLVTTWQTRSN